MQPKLHISDAWSYWRSTRHSSGALYHLEPTCTDIHRFNSLRFAILLNSVFPKISCSLKFVAPYIVIYLFISFRIYIELNPDKSLHSSGTLRDIPKSHILAPQLGVSKILADLKSLCTTLISWIKHKAHSILYVTLTKWLGPNLRYLSSIWSRSDSKYSITRHIWLMSIELTYNASPYLMSFRFADLIVGTLMISISSGTNIPIPLPHSILSFRFLWLIELYSLALISFSFFVIYISLNTLMVLYSVDVWLDMTFSATSRPVRLHTPFETYP